MPINRRCSWFSSGRVASNISSGVGEYSLFHGGSVISKRLLGQPGFSDLGLRCVSSTGLFISLLSGRVASNTCSGVGEYFSLHGGSVISKRLLGQPGFSDFGLRCVSSTGFFISSLAGRVDSNTCSGVGEYSLFHRSSVVSKRLLGQTRSSEFTSRCVSSRCLYFFLVRNSS